MGKQRLFDACSCSRSVLVLQVVSCLQLSAPQSIRFKKKKEEKKTKGGASSK